MWYAEESSCARGASGACGLGAPLTGRTFIRDLITGTESSSIDTALFDSWPHAGAA